jgi:hypothetical protein
MSLALANVAVSHLDRVSRIKEAEKLEKGVARRG